MGKKRKMEAYSSLLVTKYCFAFCYIGHNIYFTQNYVSRLNFNLISLEIDGSFSNSTGIKVIMNLLN